MSATFHEALSPTDYTFLITETPELHMHVQSVMVFDARPLTTSDDGIDFEAIKNAYGAKLHLIPRYRQKLMWQTKSRKSPYLKWISWQQSDESKPPVWIDDDHFNVDYHVRHTSLPKPGSEQQLTKLAARIAAQPLDRSRPLWEIWVVEGLQENRFAIISKMHHCMVDAKSGIDLLNITMSTSPEYKARKAKPYKPRPAPSQKELRDESLRDQVMAPVKIAESITSLWKESDSFSQEIATRAKALGETFASSIGKKRTPSVLNGDNGPHRTVAFHDTPLDYIKDIRRALGCSVNDVVLTIVTAAFRDTLLKSDQELENLPFRVAAPVSTWGRDQGHGATGNEVTSWTIDLPVHIANPVDQLAQIHEITSELKDSNHALAVDMITSFIEYTPGLMSLAARNASGPINSIVTNMPGPQFPLYYLGAQMQRSYPVVPLLESMGIGIGMMSYNGILCWGITSDLDIVADLAPFIKSLEKSIARVGKAAGLAKPPKVKI
jgi:WS/DGAT/MGAT family acyltransferase